MCINLCHIDVSLFGSESEEFLISLRYWILLDNQSTADIFCNSDLLKDIRETNEWTTILTNGGTLKTNLKGQLEDYGLVWYHPDAITNILSLAAVIQKYPVTYSSELDNSFVVHKPEGNRKFNMVDQGLWCFDVRDKRNFAFVQTVEEIRKQYT